MISSKEKWCIPDIIFCIQVRSSPNSGFGPIDEVTCGGNALRFYAAVRLRIKRTQLLKTEDEVILLLV
jgi:recombination protein RecA